MIDLHLHLLPGVDDGSSSMEVTREMLTIASELGFTRLVATPHLDGPLDAIDQLKAEHLTEHVREAASPFGIKIDQGFEIQLDPGLAARLQDGARVTLAGSRTVLVELPFGGWPHHAEHSLFQLQTAGFRPLLAHPERYTAVQAGISKAVELANRGIMLQVTFSSLSGLFGRNGQRVAEELLKLNLVTVLATDAHGAGQRLKGVAGGLSRARELVGEERIEQLVRTNAEALLADLPLPEPAPAVPTRVHSSGRFKGLASKLLGA